ncbi:hypothetical protein GCM10025865_03780 [Paraoerskovia sediminicola]|uniref:Uncharacterized protein n=1 Tax=Paraoerskovia sediminicola TaxID=1138587 RepID=A0ABM8FZ86_9CELL|nr:hypothetical protein [Paraoerskovia sediminicola]BDZ41079.1 hypothetical protein GCM10025865_03780 [Paraoerskovia sediminicola]
MLDQRSPSPVPAGRAAGADLPRGNRGREIKGDLMREPRPSSTPPTREVLDHSRHHGTVTRRLVPGLTALGLLAPLTLLAAPAHALAPDVAAGTAATATSTNAPYGTANLVDGNQATYWESTNGTLPSR